MNRLCMVLAHGGAKQTVLRHLPIWSRVSDRVIICSPADDPLALAGEWCFVNGQSGRYDAKTNIRTLEALKLAFELKPHRLIFCEYDALCWNWPEIADQMKCDQVLASKFISADRMFAGTFYLHSPIIFGVCALRRTIAAMMELPRDAERGFGDRYFGLAVERAGVDVINGHDHGLSYSQNEITRANLQPAKQAIANGACLTHGVKDAAVLSELLQAAKIGY